MQKVNADLVTIGDEILIGQIVDSNSAWLAQQLNKAGIWVRQITSISDSPSAIRNTLADLSGKSQVVIVTGGLGPTKDDKTKASIAEYFGSRLEMNQEILDHIIERLSGFGVAVNENNRNQALVPHNCTPLFNQLGTAPGMYFLKDDVHYFFLPGVPFEMKGIYNDHIAGILLSTFDTEKILHRTIMTVGIAESNLADKLEEWEDSLPEHIKLAYLPRPGVVRLRLSGSGSTMDELKSELNVWIEKLYRLIPEYIAGDEDEILEHTVGLLLKQNGKTLATAESCTGGSIASRITSIAGASTYFKGTIVAYDNAVKTKMLHVNPQIIEEHGAVSEAVVCSMVRGAIDALDVDYAIATSGIAGPDGGTADKPVGTIWIAVGNKSLVKARKYNFGKNRERNIERTTVMALNLIRKFILADKN